MKIILIIIGIVLVLLLALFSYCLCVISSRCSREEEMEQRVEIFYSLSKKKNKKLSK